MPDPTALLDALDRRIRHLRRELEMLSDWRAGCQAHNEDMGIREPREFIDEEEWDLVEGNAKRALETDDADADPDAVAQLRAALTPRSIPSALHSFCPQCGPNVDVDDEGCCLACGSTATGEAVFQLGKLVRSEAETEVLRAALSWEGHDWSVSNSIIGGAHGASLTLRLGNAVRALPPDELARLGGSK